MDEHINHHPKGADKSRSRPSPIGHRRPFVGVSQGRSWSPWGGLGAILWVFIAKS